MTKRDTRHAGHSGNGDGKGAGKAAPRAEQSSSTIVEYPPGTAFPGVAGRSFDVSTPAWPQPLRSRPGMPNVLFIVLDDTGYGHLGCYGSPIRTPNIDRLAQNGLRYSSMHTTALCSPTRACLITGRNHHSNNMACITEGATGYPGYNGIIPFENGFLPEILHQQGYSTFALGKWHLTPTHEVSAAGPYDRWPLGRGFDRFYGFLGGDTHQYYPDLVHDNHQDTPPRTPEQGYHLTEDLVDRAIGFIADTKQVAPDKPFYMYFCTGAMHAPHHAPKQWVDKYKGAFDEGWGKYRERTFQRQLELGLFPKGTQLSPQDPDVQNWDELPQPERALYARMMEVFAGFLEHTDHHIGRLLTFLETIGELDNTLIMLISDNGASAEGGPHGSINENKFFNNVPDSLEQNLAALGELGGPKYFNHYPWGWTWAGNTPFRRWKRETFRGGVSDPFIVHWPKGIESKGEIRHQYAHAIDLVPTVLECLDVKPPTHIRGVSQAPLEGVSFAHTFDAAEAPSRHQTQYFEMFAHRSLYHDGWRAVCPWPGSSFSEGRAFGAPLTAEALQQLDATGWQLYHVETDPAECHDVAAQHRGRVIEMISLWYAQAGKYNVLPLDSRGTLRLAERRPTLSKHREAATYFPGTQVVPEGQAPRLLNRQHSITAEVEVPAGGAEGVLVSQGGVDGGYSFYVKNGRLCYAYNYVAAAEFRVVSRSALPTGKLTLRFEFTPTGQPDIPNGKGAPGRAELFVNGKQVGQADFPYTIPLTFGLAGGVAVGREEGAPVTSDYSVPFEFTGKLFSVTIDARGEVVRDDDAEMRAVMAHQ
jgi:arylsulfatase A-like enzyme